MPAAGYSIVSKTVFQKLIAAAFIIIYNSIPLFLSAQAKDTASILRLIDKGSQLTDQLPNEALKYLNEALEKSRQINYPKGIALSSAKLGKWYFGNDINKAINLGRQALNSYEANSWSTVDNLVEVHLLLAESYDETGYTDSSAYFYYLLSDEMSAGNINDPDFAIAVCTKLAIFWMNLDNGTPNPEYVKTTQRLVEKAKEVSKQIKDPLDASSSVLFIQGAYYQGVKQFDSARYCYLKYIAEREQLGKLRITRKISTLFNIADTYLQENNPADAVIYINKIKEIGKDPENTQFLAFYLTLIDFLTAKAMFQQKQFAEAAALLNKTQEELKKTGKHVRLEVIEAYKLSAESYEAMHDYEKALKYKNIYLSLYDSLTKKDKVDMISRLEIRYRLSEKDKELAIQKLTLSDIESKVRYKNFWIVFILLISLLGILIFGLWRNKNIHKQKLQEQNISNLQQKMKIEGLHASIAGEEKERTRMARELHDGIGGLLSAAKMNFEILKNKIPAENKADFIDGVELLETAGSELRQVANNLMPEVLLEEGLAVAVGAFCERMASKSNTQITFQSFGTQKNIGQLTDLPIYRILQELIHNIVKHAKAKTALVQINFQDDDGLSITVEDDGTGIPDASFNNAKGMGLKNIKDRIKELSGKIDIQSSPENGTGFYIEFQPENIKT
ncbi:MAG: histidine kinase [Ferruginibacter sp.]